MSNSLYIRLLSLWVLDQVPILFFIVFIIWYPIMLSGMIHDRSAYIRMILLLHLLLLIVMSMIPEINTPIRYSIILTIVIILV